MKKIHIVLVSLFLLTTLAPAYKVNAAVINVNSNTDVQSPVDGICSLREAITASDTNIASGVIAGECLAGSVAPLRDLIRFSISGLITLDPVLGGLPPLLDGFAVVDGWAAPAAGPGRRPRVAISCGLLAPLPPGVLISSERNVVRGLRIVNCGVGIAINHPNGTNWVYGNVVGLTSGGVPSPNVNGIIISAGSQDNLIGTNGDGFRDRAERNVISGNMASGILITGINTSGNHIAGNIIGTDPRGTFAPAPNQNFGILIGSGALSNIIGTNSDGNYDDIEGNLISGNNMAGIWFSGGSENIVAGNLIGTNAAGDSAIPNHDGISIGEAATTTLVGTNGDGISDSHERNIISGNDDQGVEIQGNQNTISGNYIGLGLDGITQIANLSDGINIYRGPLKGGGTDNQIGGPSLVFANHVSANSVRGISQEGDRSTIECNIIGRDSAGDSAPNGFDGLMIEGDDNTIRGNDFADHALRGLFLSVSGVNFNIEQNNFEGNTTGVLSTIPSNIIIKNNWWGDPTGPFHATGNPAGLGDSIDNGGGATFDYEPWLVTQAAACQ